MPWTSWGLKERSCQYSIHGQAECLCDDCHQPLECLLRALILCRGRLAGSGEDRDHAGCVEEPGSRQRGTVAKLFFFSSRGLGFLVLLRWLRVGAEMPFLQAGSDFGKSCLRERTQGVRWSPSHNVGCICCLSSLPVP